jgi:hypothetical protein
MDREITPGKKDREIKPGSHKVEFEGRVVFIRSPDYPELGRVELYDPEKDLSFYANCDPEVLEEVGLVEEQAFTYTVEANSKITPVPLKELSKEEIDKIRKELEENIKGLD